MLQEIKKRSGSWVVKTLIGFIAFTFVLWGTSSLWSLLLEPEEVAAVNDEPIYIGQYENAYTNARRTAEENLAALEVLSRDKQRELRQVVLEEMINSILVRQAADEEGLGLSPAQLDQIIVNDPTFQIQGKFEQRVYTGFLRNSRLNSRGYKDYLVRRFKRNTYLDGHRAAAFYTSSMLEDYIAWKFREYTYRYAELPAPAKDRNDLPAEHELRVYYEENSRQYFLPDRYTVRYAHLSREKTERLAVVEESEPDNLYNERYGGALLQANVSIYHILFNDPGAIDEGLIDRSAALSEGIQTLQEFNAAARANSEDTVTAANGGYIGNLPIGQLPTSFVGAIRDLPPGEKKTPPFRSNLGVHLMWVDNMTDVDVPAFAEVREELIEEVRYEQTEELLLEKAEFLSDYIQSEGQLPPVTEDFPYPTEQSDTLTAASPLVLEFGQAFAEELVLTESGQTSDVIWLDDGSFLAFEMQETVPAELRGYEEVMEQVAEDYLNYRARQRFLGELTETIDKINNGSLDPDAAARVLSPVNWETADTLSRAKEFRTETEDRILASVSSHRVPFANYTQTEDGGYLLFVVDDITVKSSESLEDELRLQTREEYRAALSLTTEQWLLETLNDKADIKINAVSDIGR